MMAHLFPMLIDRRCRKLLFRRVNSHDFWVKFTHSIMHGVLHWAYLSPKPPTNPETAKTISERWTNSGVSLPSSIAAKAAFESRIIASCESLAVAPANCKRVPLANGLGVKWSLIHTISLTYQLNQRQNNHGAHPEAT